PFPVKLPVRIPDLLATGSDLKNTFCVSREPYAFLSQNLGDMGTLETVEAFEKSVSHFEKLFRMRPERIAHDLHPDYSTTRFPMEYSARYNIPHLGVQ